jgi:hypothetical protein
MAGALCVSRYGIAALSSLSVPTFSSEAAVAQASIVIGFANGRREKKRWSWPLFDRSRTGGGALRNGRNIAMLPFGA